MNNIQVFQNAQFGQIRTAVTESGEPLFCLTDVCKVLEIKNTTQVAQRLDAEDKPMLDIGLKNKQAAIFVTEPGMYTVILRSDSPKAKPMQKWVTSEVLPALRKTGMYATPDTVERMLADPDAMISALTALRDERAKRISAEAEKARLIEQNELSRRELQAAAPKVEYYEDVLSSEDTMKTTQIAKELGMGAVTLNEKLRALGVQYKVNGQWVLTYKYQNKGYTKTNTVPFIHRDGTKGTQMQTVWTEKGRQFIHEKLSN